MNTSQQDNGHNGQHQMPHKKDPVQKPVNPQGGHGSHGQHATNPAAQQPQSGGQAGGYTPQPGMPPYPGQQMPPPQGGAMPGAYGQQPAGYYPPYPQQPGYYQPQPGAYYPPPYPPQPGFAKPPMPGAAQPPRPGAPAMPPRPGMPTMKPPMGGAGFSQGMINRKPPVDDSPYTFGDLIKNHAIAVSVPKHSTQFDEQEFLKLLGGSISLTKDEKRKILESIPRLTQKQVDDLISILTDERNKFIELSEKHKQQLRKLEQQHFNEWKDLEHEYTQEKRAEKDAEDADEIRKKLGL